MSKIFSYGLSIVALLANVYAGPDGLYTNDDGNNMQANNNARVDNPFKMKQSSEYVTDKGEGAAPLINGKTPMPIENDNASISTTPTNDSKRIIPMSESSTQISIENPYKKTANNNTSSLIQQSNNSINIQATNKSRQPNTHVLKQSNNESYTISSTINNNIVLRKLDVIEKNTKDIKPVMNQSLKIINDRSQQYNKIVMELLSQIRNSGIVALQDCKGKTKLVTKSQIYNISSKQQDIKNFPTMLPTNILFPSKHSKRVMNNMPSVQQVYQNVVPNQMMQQPMYNQSNTMINKQYTPQQYMGLPNDWVRYQRSQLIRN